MPPARKAVSVVARTRKPFKRAHTPLLYMMSTTSEEQGWTTDSHRASKLSLAKGRHWLIRVKETAIFGCGGLVFEICDLSCKNVHQRFCLKWPKPLVSHWQPVESFHKSVGGVGRTVVFFFLACRRKKAVGNFCSKQLEMLEKAVHC